MKKGFTIIELLVVIAICSIIMAIVAGPIVSKIGNPYVVHFTPEYSTQIRKECEEIPYAKTFYIAPDGSLLFLNYNESVIKMYPPGCFTIVNQEKCR